MWFQPRNHSFRDPIEEARQMQVGHDKHHREKQHDRAEVDEAEGILDAYRPVMNIRRADDGRSGRSIFIPGNFPKRRRRNLRGKRNTCLGWRVRTSRLQVNCTC